MNVMNVFWISGTAYFMVIIFNGSCN